MLILFSCAKYIHIDYIVILSEIKSIRPRADEQGAVSRGIGACRGRDLSMPDFISKFDLIAERGRRASPCARTFNYTFHL